MWKPQRSSLSLVSRGSLASLLKEVCATVPSDRQTVDSLLQRAYQLEIKEKHIDAVGRESGSGAF